MMILIKYIACLIVIISMAAAETTITEVAPGSEETHGIEQHEAESHDEKEGEPAMGPETLTVPRDENVFLTDEHVHDLAQERPLDHMEQHDAGDFNLYDDDYLPEDDDEDEEDHEDADEHGDGEHADDEHMDGDHEDHDDEHEGEEFPKLNVTNSNSTSQTKTNSTAPDHGYWGEVHPDDAHLLEMDGNSTNGNATYVIEDDNSTHWNDTDTFEDDEYYDDPESGNSTDSNHTDSNSTAEDQDDDEEVEHFTPEEHEAWERFRKTYFGKMYKYLKQDAEHLEILVGEGEPHTEEEVQAKKQEIIYKMELLTEDLQKDEKYKEEADWLVHVIN